MINGVSNNQPRTASCITVGELIRAVDITSTNFVVVGGQSPHKASLRRGGTRTCTARSITNADGPLDIDELPIGYVDGGACVDDQLGTFGNLNVALQVHGTGPGFNTGHGPLGCFVHGHGRWETHQPNHDGEHVEQNE